MTATADCRLWVMERAFYNAIKHAHTEAASQQKRTLLDGVPLLALLRPVWFWKLPASLLSIYTCTSELCR